MLQRQNLYVTKTNLYVTERNMYVIQIKFMCYKELSFEVRDLFKKARGPRGVTFPKYEPVASLGDPKSARNPES